MPTPLTYFHTPAAFRKWLHANHSTAAQLLIGFVKTHAVTTERPSLTWTESVAEALCYGWIDGVRKRIDEEHYSIRFTPRRKESKWSAVNIRLIAQLEKSGRMTAAGRAAFESRPHKSGPESAGYSYEKREAQLSPAFTREFKSHPAAYTFFSAQSPGYRKLIAWWVMSAKKPETQQSRITKLIAASEAAKRIQ